MIKWNEVKSWCNVRFPKGSRNKIYFTLISTFLISYGSYIVAKRTEQVRERGILVQKIIDRKEIIAEGLNNAGSSMGSDIYNLMKAEEELKNINSIQCRNLIEKYHIVEDKSLMLNKSSGVSYFFSNKVMGLMKRLIVWLDDGIPVCFGNKKNAADEFKNKFKELAHAMWEETYPSHLVRSQLQNN